VAPVDRHPVPPVAGRAAAAVVGKRHHHHRNMSGVRWCMCRSLTLIFTLTNHHPRQRHTF